LISAFRLPLAEFRVALSFDAPTKKRFRDANNSPPRKRLAF